MQRTVNNTTFTSAMEDGSQTAEIRAILANMYMQREFVHGLPLKVAEQLYSEVVNAIYADGMKNEDKLNKIAILIHNLRIRAANQMNTDNLLGLACIYFYIDGEDPLNHTGDRDHEKIALMKSTADDMLFFCVKACEFTPALKQVSEIDLADFLKAADSLIDSQKLPT